MKCLEYKLFVFELEGYLWFPAGRTEYLSRNFQLLAVISTPAAPVKYRYLILSRSLLEAETS